MLSDRDALFAAVCANPEEDTPRLMFADWLDEHGEPERAEFIRLQCELARLAEDGSDSQPLYEFLCEHDYVTRPSADWTKIDDGIHRRIALAMRAEDLSKRHGERWVPKLPKKFKVEWDGFQRGFPHRVTLGSLRNLKEVAERLRAAVPPITLVADNFTGRVVEQLADVGLLGWISGLELVDECATGLREYGSRPEAAGVRTIRVNDDQTDNFIWAIAESPHWSDLQTLDLTKCEIGSDAAESLFRAKHFHTLRRLHPRGAGDWTTDAIRAFSESGFSNLASLRFSDCGLDDNAAEVLANCPHLANLRKLDLSRNNITGRGVTALLTSPHLANVAFLDLAGNPCAGVDAKRLVDATPGALRMFHAHGCRFRTADIRALARCPRLRTLWYLDLDDNNLNTAAVRELVRGFGKWCPPIMWLTYNRIDDRGAELLAKWKAASALRVLHLKYNPITEAGIRTLLASPHLAQLDGLGVSTLDDELNTLLRARFRHHDINY